MRSAPVNPPFPCQLLQPAGPLAVPGRRCTSLTRPEGGGGVCLLFVCGTGHLGRTETQRGRLWTACGQRCVDSKNSQTRPRQQPAHPQYANYWAPLTRKQHIPPHSAQSQHTDHWAPRTRKRHQQEHRPQRPTERSDLTQHWKGRTGDRPGPRKGATTRRNVTQGGGCLLFVCARGIQHPVGHHWGP